MDMPRIDPALLSDRSDEVPDLKQYLRPGEKVLNVEYCKTPSLYTLPDYRDELAKLCGVDKHEDIGMNGPAAAARAAVPGKGQGLFECRFGRDGLIAANDLMPEFPLLARTTLLDYASLIGMIEDLYRAEEFGRMFHEARSKDEPVNLLQISGNWDWPYYGSVDSTPLFVKLLYKYVTTSKDGLAFLDQTYTGRDGNKHTMWDALSYCMTWMVARIHKNMERFLEYKPEFPESLENQVMEDSYDSHFHADGALANKTRGICSTEVQGLVYDALLMTAELMEPYRHLVAETMYCRKLARDVRKNVSHLVVEDEKGSYLAVGSDRDERGLFRPLKVRKAMPFTTLNTRLFADQNVENDRLLPAFVRTIFSPALLCAGGVRSLAIGEARYMPGAYHNGNSWPMQTFHIAEGLRAHGFHALAQELDRRVEKVVEETNLYPEYVRGDSEDTILLNDRIVDTYDSIDMRRNRREQPAQQITLWSLAAYAAIQFRKLRKENGDADIAIQPIEEEILKTL